MNFSRKTYEDDPPKEDIKTILKLIKEIAEQNQKILDKLIELVELLE